MLTEPEVVTYLLERKLLSEEAIVRGTLAIENNSRRNLNFKVTGTGGPALLLKQATGPEGQASVANEAAAYRYIHDHGEPGSIGRFLPQLFDYDAERGVLILELCEGARSLREGKAATLPRVGAALGVALAALHRVADPQGRIPRLPPPWVLSVHRPELRAIWDTSSANIELIRIIQQHPAFGEVLQSLAADWRPGALVHFDMKADNILWLPSAPDGRGSRLRLVDWETAGWGDPCWDCGAVFGDYLGAWLLSMPVSARTDPGRLLELARVPLQRVHPPMRAFWDAYVPAASLSPGDAERWLARSVRFGAARLIQTAVEMTQMSTQVTGNAVCFLQVAFNMLCHPAEATVQLLGITRQAARVL